MMMPTISASLRIDALFARVTARAIASKKSTTKCPPRDFSSSRAPRERAHLSLQHLARQKCPPNRGKNPQDKNYCEINILVGWGGRIRTSEFGDAVAGRSKL